MGLDLKSAQSGRDVMAVVEKADVLIEDSGRGHRTLGLGPDACLARNPRLIYGRVTGWGQDGPLAQSAAHDINYIAVSGALHAIGGAGQPPVPPLISSGTTAPGPCISLRIACALVERHGVGQGQVIDAASVTARLASCPSSTGRMAGLSAGLTRHQYPRGGAPWYGVMRLRTGKYIAVGQSKAASTGCCWNAWIRPGEFCQRSMIERAGRS